MRHALLAASLVVGALLGTISVAAAQACVGGRVAVEQGYCRWPGQHADAATGNCLGPPRCPPGWAATGNVCVASESAAPLSVEARGAREPDSALMGVGIAMIVVGYLGAAITDSFLGQQRTSLGGVADRHGRGTLKADRTVAGGA